MTESIFPDGLDVLTSSINNILCDAINKIEIKVGIDGSTDPNSLDYKVGNLNKITDVTDTYDVLVTDSIIVCSKPTPFTITLPVAATGLRFYIKNIGAGIVTVEGNSSDTIDGELNQDVYQWDCMVVQYQAANAWIIL